MDNIEKNLKAKIENSDQDHERIDDDINLSSCLCKSCNCRHGSRRIGSGWFLGLVAGLIGGVLGSLYVAPLYQEKILRDTMPNSSVENRKIVVDEDSAVIASVEKVNASVVSIVITRDLPKFEQSGNPFEGFFFSVPSGETVPQQIGAGSGFIVSSDGMIVTNKHVVADTKAEYTVVTKDGKKYPGKVLATDPFNDLAIIKIEATGLPVLELGDSDKLKIGQRVIAIGNALGEFQNTVTTGVVSGIGRNISAGGRQGLTERLSEVLQTDAAINPGNSGGPLVNLAGQAIGVNTAVSLEGQLIGFAIPINQIKEVISDVKAFGKIRRAFLGVRYTAISESFAKINKLSVNYGVVIVRGDEPSEPAVVSGSPAQKAGLVEGDIILEFDGKKIDMNTQLTDLLRTRHPGDQVTLKVLSGETDRIVNITLGEAQ